MGSHFARCNSDMKDPPNEREQPLELLQEQISGDSIPDKVAVSKVNITYSTHFIRIIHKDQYI